MSDPFAFIVGQIVASASREIEQENEDKRRRIEKVHESLVGFKFIKDWRIAYPEQYRDAKILKVDYSHLKRRRNKTPKRNDPSLTDIQRARLDEHYDGRIMGHYRATAFPKEDDRGYRILQKWGRIPEPIAWKWHSKEEILEVAKQCHQQGKSYLRFQQEFDGARTAIVRFGCVNELRAIWGIKPFVHWSEENALAFAKEFAQKGGTRIQFTHENAYYYFKKKRCLHLLDPILPKTQNKKWTVENAFALAKQLAMAGEPKKAFYMRFTNAYKKIRNQGLGDELDLIFSGSNNAN